MRISDWSSDVCSSDLLRVEGGGLKLAVPVAYDYLTGSVSTEARQMALSPSGREIDVEASYGFSLGGGRMDANAYWRKDPGHIAGAPHATGMALRYRLDFCAIIAPAGSPPIEIGRPSVRERAVQNV